MTIWFPRREANLVSVFIYRFSQTIDPTKAERLPRFMGMFLVISNPQFQFLLVVLL